MAARHSWRVRAEFVAEELTKEKLARRVERARLLYIIRHRMACCYCDKGKPCALCRESMGVTKEIKP